jgi:hypothetical protein
MFGCKRSVRQRAWALLTEPPAGAHVSAYLSLLAGGFVTVIVSLAVAACPPQPAIRVASVHAPAVEARMRVPGLNV